MYPALLERLQARLSEGTPVAGVVKIELSNGGDWIVEANTVRAAQPAEKGDCCIAVSQDDLRRLIDQEADPKFLVMQRRANLSGDSRLGLGVLARIREQRQVESAGPVESPLPEATTDLARARADLEAFGYCLIRDALTAGEVQALRTRLVEQAAAEREIGRAYLDGGDGPADGPNQRVWFLVNKGQEFRDLLEHPLVDDLVVPLVGEDLIVFSFSANIAAPGGLPMVLHTDQNYIQPRIDFLVGLNIAWYLDDVTEANGGTRVIPGSHKAGREPVDPRSLEGTVAATAPAGTALVFESRLWHGTGPNVSDEKRHILLSYFVRYFLRQQENPFLTVAPAVEASLSEKVKARLGYRVTATLGSVEGPKEGALVKRPEVPLEKLRPGAS